MILENEGNVLFILIIATKNYFAASTFIFNLKSAINLGEVEG